MMTFFRNFAVILNTKVVLGMTLNCIHIFIVTGSFLYVCHESGKSAFLHTQFYLSTNLDPILFSNVAWH